MRSLGALLLLLPLTAGCLGFHQGAMPGEPASAKFAQIDGVRVRASGSFDSDTWASTGIVYGVDVDSPASVNELARLLDRVDEVAEIPRAIRAGATVQRA